MKQDFTAPMYDKAQKISVLFFWALLTVMIFCIAAPRSLVFAPSAIGIGGLIAVFVGARRLPAFDYKLAGFLAAFLGIAALSVFWSLDQTYALERVVKITPLFASGLILLSMCNLPVFTKIHLYAASIFLILFCSFAALMIFSEYHFGFPVMRYILGIGEIADDPSIQNGFILNRNLVYLVLLSFTSLLALQLSDLKKSAKFALVFLLFSTLGAALWHTKSQTAQLVALIGLLMFLYPAHRKKARYFMAGSVIAFMFMLPVLINPAYMAISEIKAQGFAKRALMEASVIHRFEVWNFVSDKIKEKPIFGHGLEATRFLKSDKVMPYMETDHVIHPHNVILQIWVEFGIVGIILAAAFVIFLVRRLDTMPSILQRYYSILFIMIFCVLCISYGLWQAWQIGMIFAITGLNICISRIYEISPKIGAEKALKA